MMKAFLFKGSLGIILLNLFFSVVNQAAVKDADSAIIAPRFAVGVSRTSPEMKITLAGKWQSFNKHTKHPMDFYEPSVYSPKSALFSKDGSKFYVHSLEGFNTSVFDSRTHKLLKVITHSFNASNQHLFKDGETTVFDYTYHKRSKDFNIFQGKPVESCLSHQGKYLWVTYYRRDYDVNAISPSAVAIIDTDSDSIVRVMPTGPLPKMIRSSTSFIAVTHWGDNTVALIDIRSSNPFDFKMHSHLIVDKRAVFSFGDKVVDRDAHCGSCLRGTVFTPDEKYLLVGKMGGSGEIAVFDVQQQQSIGNISGHMSNLRHMIIFGDYIYISTNSNGYVQKAKWQDLIDQKIANGKNKTVFKGWKSVYVGKGARTIEISPDGKYVFACINLECKISVIEAATMTKICDIDADAFPVGMAISPSGKQLVVTSQGRSNKGGNSVMLYTVEPVKK
jgi:DNA-binding beta-propeller fold protein YncE